MKKLLALALLLVSASAWAAFDPTQPYATVANACGGQYKLQGGTFYDQNNNSVGSSLPSCNPPSTNTSSGTNNWTGQNTFSNINVTGGAVNGTPIGATTPSTGAFTTLSATGNATLGGNESVTGTMTVTGASTLAGGISSYNGVATVGNGVPAEYAQVNLVNQNANISSTTAYAVPSAQGGFYRVSCYAVVTTADGASSTLPNIGVGWTDSDSSVALLAGTVTSTNTANAAGAFSQGQQIVYAKGGSNITYQTSNYASGTAGAMKYSVHIKVEYLN
jgi:hypothetical protein